MEVEDGDCLGSSLITEASWRESVERSIHGVGLQIWTFWKSAESVEAGAMLRVTCKKGSGFLRPKCVRKDDSGVDAEEKIETIDTEVVMVQARSEVEFP